MVCDVHEVLEELVEVNMLKSGVSACWTHCPLTAPLWGRDRARAPSAPSPADSGPNPRHQRFEGQSANGAGGVSS